MDTPPEEVSLSLLEEDWEAKLPDAQRLVDSSEESLRNTTDSKSLEVSELEKDLTREVSWEEEIEDASVVFASTSNETTPNVTPKVSPIKQAKDKILIGIGVKKSLGEFRNMEFKKSLSKHPDFGNVSKAQSRNSSLTMIDRIKGFEDNNLLDARTTRKSLSDRTDV